MEKLEALDKLRVLAEGVNPTNGALLADSSVCNQLDVVRALGVGVTALEREIEQDKKRANLPANTGKPWSQEDESQLVARFDEGLQMNELAKELQRTIGGVEARLVKLGKFDDSRVVRW